MYILNDIVKLLWMQYMHVMYVVTKMQVYAFWLFKRGMQVCSPGRWGAWRAFRPTRGRRSPVRPRQPRPRGPSGRSGRYRSLRPPATAGADGRCRRRPGEESPAWRASCRRGPRAAWSSGGRTLCSARAFGRALARSPRAASSRLWVRVARRRPRPLRPRSRSPSRLRAGAPSVSSPSFCLFLLQSSSMTQYPNYFSDSVSLFSCFQS